MRLREEQTAEIGFAGLTMESTIYRERPFKAVILSVSPAAVGGAEPGLRSPRSVMDRRPTLGQSTRGGVAATRSHCKSGTRNPEGAQFFDVLCGSVEGKHAIFFKMPRRTIPGCQASPERSPV